MATRKARRLFEAVIKAFQVEVWIENMLFLLLVLSLIGYTIYRGWLHYHLH